MMMNYKSFQYILIAFIGAILFIPALGNVHLFDWDEINFAECAREMIISKNYLLVQIDFQPFWEKPPLFIWLQVMSMKVFGINEFAARFPNAMMGVVTLLTLFYVGKKVANEKVAFMWITLYTASWLPHFYFKSGIIDPTFNFFIFLAFFQVHLIRFSNKSIIHALFAGLFIGLAVLTKGPVAALVALLSFLVFLTINRGLNGFKIFHLLCILIAAIIPFGLWFGATILQNGWTYGSWFMNEFINYQIRLFSTEDADHGGPFVYHFIVLLLGCFPASIFFLQNGKPKLLQSKSAVDFHHWMKILFWVVLILFSIVKTKIVHYSSLCYFPLTFLAALKLEALVSGELKMKRWNKTLFILIGCFWGLFIGLIPFIGIFKAHLYPYIDDGFAIGNLHANVLWSYSESLYGLFLFAGIIFVSIKMKNNFKKSILALAVFQIIFIQITLLHFTPKIEAYSQRTAINYFTRFVGKDVYVQVLGYKSYAHLFYTQKLPATNKNYYNENWLLHGQVDKPTYFICKNTEATPYLLMSELVKTGEENGFVFFKRR